MYSQITVTEELRAESILLQSDISHINLLCWQSDS